MTATPDDRSGAAGGWCWSESGRRWQRDEVVRGGAASGFCGGEGEVYRRRLYATDAQSDVSGAGLRSCEPLRVWRQAAVCAM